MSSRASKHPQSPARVLPGSARQDVSSFLPIEDNPADMRLIQEGVAEAGAQDYVVKGIPGFDHLARTIRYAIERFRLVRELRQARDEQEDRVAERTAELERANQRLRLANDERRSAEEEAPSSWLRLARSCGMPGERRIAHAVPKRVIDASVFCPMFDLEHKHCHLHHVSHHAT